MGVPIPKYCRFVLLRVRFKEVADEACLRASLPGEDDRVLFLDDLGISDFFTEPRPLKERKVGHIWKFCSLICIITIFKKFSLPLSVASFRNFHVS